MIKYEKEVEALECTTDIENHNDNECNFDENKPAIKKLIHSLLLRQIDEDNKRFLGMIGEDEKHKDNLTHDKDELWCCIDCYDDKIKNKLRAELRNKVNKK